MKRPLVLCAAALAALSVGPSSALAQWSDLGLSGRAIEALRAADGWLFACTSDGLYRKASDTADSSWALLGFSGQRVYDVLWVTADTLIAAREITGTGADTVALLRSTDGGANWNPFQNGIGDDNSNLNHRVIGLLAAPGSPGTLLARSPTGLRRSTNGGGEWKTVETGTLHVNFLTTGPGTIWLGGETGLFGPFAKRSINGGATWTTVFIDGNDNSAVSVGLHPTDPNTALLSLEGSLRKTTTGGFPWTPIPVSYRFTMYASRSFAPLRFYAVGSPVVSGPTFFTSDDVGLTWTPVPFDYPRGNVAKALLVHSVPGGDAIDLGTGNGVVRYLETTPVAVEPVVQTSGIALRAAPNVIHEATVLTFYLPRAARVSLDVLDLAGRRVTTLATGERPAGSHHVAWDVAGLRSGVYLCRLSTQDRAVVAKVFVVR